MNSNPVQKLTLYALFIALVAVTTMVITVPMIGTQGYVNIGDTMIFLTAILLGPQGGLIAGGIGSALADLMLGYVHWAPWTLIIKGLEGLLVGIIAHQSFIRNRKITPLMILAFCTGALWMVLGYLGAGSFLVGFTAALGSIPGNLIQGGASIIFSIPLAYGLGKLIPRLPLLEDINS